MSTPAGNPHPEYGPASSTLRRKEPRVRVALAVRIWGLDAAGAPFVENVNTRDVSLSGACVLGVTAHLNNGEIIGLQYGPEKARFRVMWSGKAEGGEGFNLGLSGVDPEKCLWLPNLTVLEQPQTYTGKMDRRKHPRFQCTGAAQIGEAGKGLRMWGTLTDISLGGCYVQTVSNMPIGTHLDVSVAVDTHSFAAKADVRTSHPNIGMGMQFIALTPENQRRLELLVERLDTKLTASLPPSVRALKQIEAMRNDLTSLETKLRHDSKPSLVALEKLARARAELAELLDAPGSPDPTKPPPR